MVEDRLESGRALEALRRKNLEGKKMFIEELRRQRTSQSISLLLEILCDESWYLRELAIGALAESGTAAVPPLRRVLGGGLWYTRAAAARTLGRLGDAESAAPILDLFEESNRTIQEGAVDAVASLVQAGGGAALAAALADLEPDRRSARLGLLARVQPDLAADLNAAAEAVVSERLHGAAPEAAGSSPESNAAPPDRPTDDGGRNPRPS